MSEQLKTEFIQDSSEYAVKKRLVALGASASFLLAGCSTEVQGTSFAKESWGELEVQKSVEARSSPSLTSDGDLRLKVGERVAGICLVFPSWESSIASGLMKIRRLDEEYYVPTFGGFSDGQLHDTFQVPEDVLNKSYLRCADPRRL